MKVIFWGSPAFANPCLQALLDKGHDVLAVVTQPDKEQGRSRTTTPPPVKVFAQSKGITVLQPESPNTDDCCTLLKRLAPDVMVVVAYGKILAKKLLAIPPYGYVNVHFSLLPKYRGASPLTAAILAGEKDTGVTIMKLVSKMDAGPILATATIPVLPSDTTGTLQQKLGEAGASLLMEVLDKLPSGGVRETPQDDSQASYCYILKKEDGQIVWNNPAGYLERFVRAMSPWPTAYTTLHRRTKAQPERIIILSSEVISENSLLPPGTINAVKPQGIDVATAQGILRITELQKAGKAPLHAADFLRGNPVAIGDILQ